MTGLNVYTNKDESLKGYAKNHFSILEENNLIGKVETKDHDSKIEWNFESVYDAIIGANFLSNHFEYCHRF